MSNIYSGMFNKEWEELSEDKEGWGWQRGGEGDKGGGEGGNEGEGD